MLNLYNYHNNPEQLEQYCLYAHPLGYIGYVNGYEREVIYDPVLHIIKRKAIWGCWYSGYVINDRWVDGEPTIMKDSQSAYYYAKHVIKDRWVEAEENIKEDNFWWALYCKEFEI